MRPISPVLLLGLTFCLSLTFGCAPGPCDEENLPEQGRTLDSEQLYKFTQYAAQQECWSELYDHLSKRTRDEHSYLKIRPFISSFRTEEPWEYRMSDLLAKGTFVAVMPGGPGGRELIYVSYQEPGKPELLAQILVVEEVVEGEKHKRLGLQEQYEEGPAINQAPAGG